MMIEFSRRAIADIRQLAADSRQKFGNARTAEIGALMYEAIQEIADDPYNHNQPPLFGRPDVYAIVLSDYQYKVYYHVFDREIQILHIRHLSETVGETVRVKYGSTEP